MKKENTAKERERRGMKFNNEQARDDGPTIVDLCKVAEDKKLETNSTCRRKMASRFRGKAEDKKLETNPTSRRKMASR